MIIDLRSDTVTQPTPGMLQAMMGAVVGDDVFGDDPTVTRLEQTCASLLGMEAGVFCPSGTMTNQIGIKILTQPYDEIICYRGAHIYKYEGGGLMGNSGVSVKLLEGNRGRISVSEISESINQADDTHYPHSAVVALENTVVREAGSCYTLKQVAEISEFSRSCGLSMHLDGARLFNAITKTGDDPKTFGKYFDTISICLSKGLGAPVGSVLLCRKNLEQKARRMRKVFGGGMRQAGYLAAAGLYALENNVSRLKEDHKRAKALGDVIQNLPFIKSMMPVDTNIIIFELDKITPAQWLARLAQHQIKATQFSSNQVRLVTHLNFDDAMLERTIEVVKKI